MTESRDEFVVRCGHPFEAGSLVRVALEAAFLAGEILRTVPRGVEYGISEKLNEGGIVTPFDRASEELIREFLLSKTSYAMLGEEDGLCGASSEKLWVVDPIDGTTNFSRGIPLSAIAIALVDRGEIMLGVVYNPFLNECFCAERDRGAFLNGRKIQVMPTSVTGKPLVFVNSGYAQQYERCAELLAERLRGKVLHRHFGTTALEICYVAAGRAEAFASIGDELWDYAAAVAVASEAGAWIVDWEGACWTIQRSDIVVAAPTCWPLLERQVHEVFRERESQSAIIE